MRDIVLIPEAAGDSVRRLGLLLLACNGLVWALVVSALIGSS
jgi:hypothetical protein